MDFYVQRSKSNFKTQPPFLVTVDFFFFLVSSVQKILIQLASAFVLGGSERKTKCILICPDGMHL